MLEENDLIGLIKIHDQFKLTQWKYTCCGIDGLIIHYKYGIEIGKITAD